MTEPPPPGPVARGTLSRGRIVDRAVDLARLEGLAAVTMRRIAGDLGVEAMSLYHYIPTKATLLILMADWSLSQLPASDSALPWDEQLVELLVQTYRAGVDNPVLFEVIASEPLGQHEVPIVDPETGVACAAFVERVLALLAGSSLPVPLQVVAYRGLTGLLIGFIVVETDGFLNTGRPHRGRPGRTEERESVKGPQMSPHIGALLGHADPTDALRTSLRWFIDGLVGAHRDPPSV